MGIRTLNTSSHVAKSANTRWRKNYCPLILFCWCLLLKIITITIHDLYLYTSYFINWFNEANEVNIFFWWWIGSSSPVLGIFALEFEGPLLNVSHEMFHSFLHWSRKVSDLACLFAKVKRTLHRSQTNKTIRTFWGHSCLTSIKKTYSMGKRWQSDDIWWLHRNFFEDYYVGELSTC